MSLPIPLRVLLAAQPELVSPVLQVHVWPLLAPRQGPSGSSRADCAPMQKTARTPLWRHPAVDDLQALLSAALVIALGLHLLRSGGLLVGGVPGLAFLLRYGTGWPLGACLMLVNGPFYALAWWALGWRFALKTLLAMSLLAVLVELLQPALQVQSIQPWLAATAGGLLVGIGLLILFRHRGSLGGLGVLALVLQRRRGWNVGVIQLVFDALILGAASRLVSGPQLAYSVLAAVAMNLALFWNHKPGRHVVAEASRGFP